MTLSLICSGTCRSKEEAIEKLRDLVARTKAALGEDNETTFNQINRLSCVLHDIGDYVEAR